MFLARKCFSSSVFLFGCLMLVVQLQEASTVPAPGKSTCTFPQTWQDKWLVPTLNKTISISNVTFGSSGNCNLELEGSLSKKSYIVRPTATRCFTCVHVEWLHRNILRFKSSECSTKRDAGKLCKKALTQKWRFLYRENPLEEECPDILSGSHSFTYSEYSATTASYIENCGDPRSETNGCNQRTSIDPQFSFNFGNCPSGNLVHRTSMTQTMNCMGSWSSGGIQYFVGVGDVWEYWEPGDYRNTDVQYTCMAIRTDGLRVYLSQGFGSECDGLGGVLNPTNGHRNLVMEKRMRLEKSCEFPDWVTAPDSWKIIPQSGLRLMEDSGSRVVNFASKSSFKLSTSDQVDRGQIFSCAKILRKTSNEVMLQTFTQSQCYGEYHCFHSLLDPQTNTAQLHVGAPSHNIEHSCVTPNFDPEVPFLMATVIPIYKSNVSGSAINVAPSGNSFNGQNQRNSVQVGASQGYIDVNDQRIKEQAESVDAIKREGMSMIHSYQQQFSQQVEAVVTNLLERVNNVYKNKDGL